ncbi:MAG: CDP-2,3-bis-(O-geranylgeranyl)-sn-glycerol synthase [Candidatus Aenigmarchaeota archaeon]|nr:CDP-2,3-bis-(O-geranylgeranyl)-sn-glycerol synthase [Candidatus Aenigmarchaeota archaeon]
MIDVIGAFWLILPAYFANASATLAKGKLRMDFSKNFFDGQPLFGAGKTFEGFLFGISVGTLIGLFQQFLQQAYGLGFSFSAGFFSSALMSFGALSGDLAGSFIKRRMKLKRGEPVLLLDQLDFVFGAVFFTSLFYTLGLDTVMLIIIMTPLIHLTANVLGYRMKLKREPW